MKIIESNNSLSLQGWFEPINDLEEHLTSTEINDTFYMGTRNVWQIKFSPQVICETFI